MTTLNQTGTAKLIVKCRTCALVQYAKWNCRRCNGTQLLPHKTQEAR